MSAATWALWGLVYVSIIGLIVGGAVIAVDRTTCTRHGRATALIAVSAASASTAAIVNAVIA
ncbi:hypothetical protein CH282_15745 [Rhodococcus sp. 06-418-1B]|nr:hypothetical protein [Rhodococcus sp. 06-418-1B]OZC83413.1 hypothetical protein CH282_15745 [Rhodococcus sp. 06-418-1B]